MGQLLGEISGDLSTLMRQEVELAKSEIRQSAKRAGKGSGMLAGAAVGGHMVLLFLSIALWWGLGNAIGPWLVGARRRRHLGDRRRDPGVDGRVQLKSVQGLPKTTDTAKKIPDALKGNEEQIDDERP